MLTQEPEGLVMRCDSCSNAFLAENSQTYRDAHAEAKAQGWLTRKVNEQWYNFCCEECYHKKLDEQNTIVNQMKADALNPDKNSNWRQEVFKDEISYIQNDALKVLVKRLLNALPDYFFKVPASSTGKYHPKYAQGIGGLVRHTKAAVRIALELLRLDMYSQFLPARDYIIIALLLHDSWKHGPITEDGSYNEYTTFDHPKVAADFVRNSALIQEDVLNYIAMLIETHMGQWIVNYKTGAQELQPPSLPEQKFIHLCDYLASRKCLEFNGEEPFED